MANSRFYSSIAAATNLQVTASPSDTSIQVASSVGWPSSFPFIVSLDYGAANEELVLVNSGGPSVFNVTRAYDGTSATTHNAGAVVRHVSSAIDFTDSRTHEASSTGVHGISGTFVDTISSQTLANKTLNTSILNSPNISGTVTGLPTFGGVVTFNNGIVVQGSSGSSVAATGTTTAWRARVTGDAIDRWAVRGDGQVQWGDGTASRDVNLYRGGADILQTDDSFISLGTLVSQRPTSGNPAVQVNISGDTNVRLQANASGSLNWGPGNAATDVSLSRSGAGALSVGGTLNVTGTLAPTTMSGNIAGNPAFTGTPTFAPTTISGSSLIPDTVANGWSLDGATGRKAAGVTTITIFVERVGGNIAANSSGNIPDTVVGTLASGWRPIDGVMITNYDMSGIATGSVSIGTDGICTMKSLMAGNTIGLADTVRFSITFVSAT